MNVLNSKTYEENLPCGSLYLTFCFNGGEKPKKIIVQVGRAGQCLRSWSDAISRTINLYLQNNGDLEELAKELRHIRCDKVLPNPEKPKSCADAIAKIIEEFIG
ncbi:MAG: TSCPD domain-containing protein [Nitrososphaeria archaeon]